MTADSRILLTLAAMSFRTYAIPEPLAKRPFAMR